MTYDIRKVGVIGAGTMGGGIAAHLANIGIPVVLLDIPTPGLSDEEKENPAARNRLVKSLYDRMVKAKPAHLGRKDRAGLITKPQVQRLWSAACERGKPSCDECGSPACC